MDLNVESLTADARSGAFAFSEQKLSPSIFVYIFPELQLKNELKGTAQLEYTSLTLSEDGPYLGSCSSFPDYTITVWNWENAEAICTQPQAGPDIVSLLFNPLSWLQLCALGPSTLTVWNIEKSNSFHLPAADGSFAEGHANKLPNTVRGTGVKTLRSTRTTLTPSAISWTATSKLYVGCAEGYLLLVDPESFSRDPDQRHTNVAVRGPCYKCPAVPGQRNVAFVCQHSKYTNVLYSCDVPDKEKNHERTKSEQHLLDLQGQIYLLNPSKSDTVLKTLDVLSGNFLTAAFLQTDRNICVVTSLACCPIAHYAAVGTESGRVLFVDLNEEEQPRLVHQVYLYHSAVDHLVYVSL
uniref:Cilia- and flagella-associated protein 43 n=1 Tax=Kryptolebias marmoratus TaxID=37003 RepID=A0A3Q3GTX4_KRYMA